MNLTEIKVQREEKQAFKEIKRFFIVNFKNNHLTTVKYSFPYAIIVLGNCSNFFRSVKFFLFSWLLMDWLNDHRDEQNDGLTHLLDK